MVLVMPPVVLVAVASRKFSMGKTPSFVIYYPTQKMPIWDVAKRFNSSKEEIIKTNSLTDTDFLPNDKPILIPKMKKSTGK